MHARTQRTDVAAVQAADSAGTVIAAIRRGGSATANARRNVIESTVGAGRAGRRAERFVMGESEEKGLCHGGHQQRMDTVMPRRGHAGAVTHASMCGRTRVRCEEGEDRLQRKVSAVQARATAVVMHAGDPPGMHEGT